MANLLLLLFIYYNYLKKKKEKKKAFPGTNSVITRIEMYITCNEMYIKMGKKISGISDRSKENNREHKINFFVLEN